MKHLHVESTSIRARYLALLTTNAHFFLLWFDIKLLYVPNLRFSLLRMRMNRT